MMNSLRPILPYINRDTGARARSGDAFTPQSTRAPSFTFALLRAGAEGMFSAAPRRHSQLGAGGDVRPTPGSRGPLMGWPVRGCLSPSWSTLPLFLHAADGLASPHPRTASPPPPQPPATPPPYPPLRRGCYFGEAAVLTQPARGLPGCIFWKELDLPCFHIDSHS